MSNYTVEPASFDYAALLAESILADDAREGLSSGWTSVYDYVCTSIARSEQPKAFLYGSEVLCCYGVARNTVLSKSGCIWCLTSVRLQNHKIAFLRRSRQWVGEKQREYDLLWNYVPVWHKKSLAWIEWLGFNIVRSVPIGGEHWYRVELRGV